MKPSSSQKINLTKSGRIRTHAAYNEHESENNLMKKEISNKTRWNICERQRDSALNLTDKNIKRKSRKESLKE